MIRFPSRNPLTAGLVAAAWGLLLAAPAQAQDSSYSLNFTFDDATLQNLGLDAAELEAELQAEADDNLHLVDQTEFLNAMANATAISAKGMGVDYASSFERFIVGGALGTGVSGGDATFGRGGDNLPDTGFAFQLSAMAGLNLGVFASGDSFLSRVKLYGSGLAYAGTTGSFTSHMYNAGGHLQLDLVKPVDLKVVGWGGLSLTTGATVSRYQLELKEELPLSTDYKDGELGWRTVGTYTVAANALSIPVEISTNVTLLKTFTVFAGGGADINVADAESDGSLQGPISYTPDGQDTVGVGDAVLTLTSSGVGEGTAGRVFGGAQLNLLKFHLYGQVNVGLSDSFGGNLGLRFGL